MARRKKKKKAPSKAVSKAQAGLFGIVAGGGTPRGGKTVSKSCARTKLRGVSVKSLPRKKR